MFCTVSGDARTESRGSHDEVWPMCSRREAVASLVQEAFLTGLQQQGGRWHLEGDAVKVMSMCG